MAKILQHRYERSDTGAEVIIGMTFDDWLDRIFSDGSNGWCITLKDGVMAYDRGLIEKKFHSTSGNWPMVSEAAGVHFSEIPDQIERDRKAGVPTQYTKDGDPVFTSRGHRKRYLKANKMHDRNGGYGD